MDQIRSFIERCGASALVGVDGCALKGLTDVYRAAGEPAARQSALDALARRVTPEGALPEDGAAALCCGKALFFALDETGDERYRKAADSLHARPEAQLGRASARPEWLYAALPFRTEYDRRFLSGLEAGSVARQFRAADADAQAWGPRETGWYLMALADSADAMAEQLYEHRRVLMDLFLAGARRALAWADPATGRFSQADPIADAMLAYALLKGVRLGLLDPERYLAPAFRAFDAVGESLATACPDERSGLGAGVLLMTWSERLRTERAGHAQPREA